MTLSSLQRTASIRFGNEAFLQVCAILYHPQTSAREKAFAAFSYALKQFVMCMVLHYMWVEPHTPPAPSPTSPMDMAGDSHIYNQDGSGTSSCISYAKCLLPSTLFRMGHKHLPLTPWDHYVTYIQASISISKCNLTSAQVNFKWCHCNAYWDIRAIIGIRLDV